MRLLTGLVHLDGEPVDPQDLTRMQRALTARATGGVDVAEPVRLPDGRWVAASARLDNRESLLSICGLPPATADASLVAAAWGRWGVGTPSRLQGDWAVAVWEPRERRVTLARDQLGNTALYVAASGTRVAWASHPAGLLCLRWVSTAINEAQACRSLSWIAPETDAFGLSATFWANISAVPPGHQLTWTTQGPSWSRYWWPLGGPRVRYQRAEDYVDALDEHLHRAVQCRLPSHGPVGATLSAGLDSGAVVAVAADAMLDVGRLVTTFTASPTRTVDWPGHVTDEWPLVSEGLPWAGVDAVRLRGPRESVLRALGGAVEDEMAPNPAPANRPWMDELWRSAADRHIPVVLTGQLGNGALSLARATLGQRLLEPLRSMQPPVGLIRRDWCTPVRRRGLWPGIPWATRARGSMMLMLGAALGGPGYLNRWMRTGVETRDVTADVRLVEFCLALPGALRQRDGVNRWPARRLLQRRRPGTDWRRRPRGLQAADAGLHVVDEESRLIEWCNRLQDCPGVRQRVNMEVWRDAWQRTRPHAHTLRGREAVSTLLLQLGVLIFIAMAEQGIDRDTGRFSYAF